jgi:hypothetical protein
LEFMKVFKDFKLVPKYVNLGKFTEIINETNIIGFTTKGINSRSPNI